MGTKLAAIVIGSVVVVWLATTIVLPIVVPNYTAPPEVGTVMGGVAGAAAGILFARRGGNGNGNGNGKKKP